MDKNLIKTESNNVTPSIEVKGQKKNKKKKKTLTTEHANIIF